MSLPKVVIIDANIIISISSKESNTFRIAENAFNKYATDGCEFFAPNVIVAEGMFALCNKLKDGILTQNQHDEAVESFIDYMTIIETPSDEYLLMQRAVEIRGTYGCSRSSDGIYIALAEELSQTRTTELLTFDKGIQNQIANLAPAVTLNLLTI